jgi:hypothetical protein
MKRIRASAKAISLSLAAATVGMVGAVTSTASAHAAEETLPTPHHLELSDRSAQTKSVERASLRYAAFWDTGNETYAKEALASDFVDRTLPAGRAPGLEGALQASKNFRAAVPDLTSDESDAAQTARRDQTVVNVGHDGVALK